jgi:hypothetical protein
MSQEKRSFWEDLFVGSSHDERKEKVLFYVVHRMKAGAHLTEAWRKSTCVATPRRRR